MSAAGRVEESKGWKWIVDTSPWTRPHEGDLGRKSGCRKQGRKEGCLVFTVTETSHPYLIGAIGLKAMNTKLKPDVTDLLSDTFNH